jgi:hypothetical protein
MSTSIRSWASYLTTKLLWGNNVDLSKNSIEIVLLPNIIRTLLGYSNLSRNTLSFF